MRQPTRVWQVEVTEAGLWGAKGMDPLHLHALWALGPGVQLGWASEDYQKDDNACITGLLGGTCLSVFH